MDTRNENRDLSSILFGKTRRAVLALLYGHPDEAFYLRQVARATGVGLGALQRELKQLFDGGILLRTSRGNQVYYQANSRSPIFAELRSLVAKTILTKERLSSEKMIRSGGRSCPPSKS